MEVFAAHEIIVRAPYQVAAARLVHLVNRGALHGASETAYEGGLEATLRIGPFGGTRGLSKLVRVHVLDPVRHDATMTFSLRWEATGVVGDLFPVLDADLILAREGEDRSRLRLVGSYRPPLGRTGAVLDRAIMGGVAAATIRSLLEAVAIPLADPVPQPEEGRTSPPWWWPVTEPGAS